MGFNFLQDEIGMKRGCNLPKKKKMKCFRVDGSQTRPQNHSSTGLFNFFLLLFFIFNFCLIYGNVFQGRKMAVINSEYVACVTTLQEMGRHFIRFVFRSADMVIAPDRKGS